MSAAGATPLDGVLEFPWEVLEYLSWLRQQPSSRAANGTYLFDAPSLRFTADDQDVIVCSPDLRVEVRGAYLGLTSAAFPRGLELETIAASERSVVADLIGLLDGQRTLAEVRLRASVASLTLDVLLERAFGRLLFAPLAVAAAEHALSGIEITRFPGSPYEIARPYWKNMAGVRARLDASPLPADAEALTRQLRELHVIALMGDDLQCYYQPASPISGGRAAPGRLMHTATVVMDTTEGSVIISGPRVSAGMLGGRGYHEALYASLGEPEASEPRRFVDAGGLDWGRLVHARAVRDAASEAWFCPPRPLEARHFERLRQLWRDASEAAARADHDGCIAALAQLHQGFVRMHPFHCGNQCLAMNIVNHVLRGLMGCGMPHLVLDHLALRLSSSAYVRVFRRCVTAYADPQPKAAERYQRMASSRTRTFELAARLSAAPSAAQAGSLLAADSATARLLLLLD